MSKVFADTFYFLALLNKKDEAHAKAVEYAGLVDEIITTEWVLIELADGLAASKHRDRFQQTREALLEDENVEIVPLDMELQEEGIEFYSSRPDQQWSLTDCISFLVMEDHEVTEALTGDHHFEQAGFVALLK